LDPIQAFIVVVFAFFFGAAMGSFLNVVIYRLPEGQSLVHPPSSCPSCRRPIGWYDNIPILSWLLLRARCRYCRKSISIQYPAVELLGGLLGVGLVVALYMTGWRADFPAAGLDDSWPALVAIAVLLLALLAGTIIDARYYLIPLEIPWTATVLGTLLLAGGAFLVPELALRGAEFRDQFIPLHLAPVADPWFFHAAMGGLVGLLLAIVLLRLGVLRQSFADEEEVLAQIQQAKQKQAEQPESGVDGGSPPDAPTTSEPAPEGGTTAEAQQHDAVATGQDVSGTTATATHGKTVAAAADSASDSDSGSASEPGSTVEPDAGATSSSDSTSTASATEPHPPTPAGVSRHAATDVPVGPPDFASYGTPEQWLEYPYARREMLKELAFVIWPILGFIVGFFVQVVPEAWFAMDAPTGPFLRVLGGCVLGYLVGGGIIWITRICGTLFIGREAMGLGDAHLLAAVGAVLGPIDSVVIFFAAPFLGLAYSGVALLVGALASRKLLAIPYGPFLSLATLILVLFRDGILAGLGMILGL